MIKLSFALICIFLLFQTKAYSQPKIEIEGNSTYDWGKINPMGAPLTAKIKIFNKGTETLNIVEVKPACGCTTAPLDKTNIEPNGYATLSVTLKVSNEGPVHKSITIKSNDPKDQTKILDLKADIIRPIGLSQDYLVFSNMEIGKEAFSTIVIINNTKKDIRIKDIIIDPKELKLSIKKNTKLNAGKELTLEARYVPSNSSILKGQITLKTDNKEVETVEISVRGSMAPLKK